LQKQIEECAQLELQLQTQITQVQMLAAMQNNSPQSPHQTSAEHDQLIRLKALTSFEASNSLLDAEYERKCKRAKLLQDAQTSRSEINRWACPEIAYHF
jgi:hypothetical protein